MQLSYPEQLQLAIRKARKLPVGEREQAIEYYSQQFAGSACVSWEQFKNSWAGQLWIKKFFN